MIMKTKCTQMVSTESLYVSFAKEPYERDDILHKRPVILRSLLIVATPPPILWILNAHKWWIRNRYTQMVSISHAEVCCSVLRCAKCVAATHCNTLQHTATHCNTLQHTYQHITHFLQNPRGITAMSAVSLAVCCSVLQCVAVCCSALQCVAVCCTVLQCVAVCCSVLQCVAVRCSWRCIRCLVSIAHFLQKSPVISGSFAEIDLRLKASYGSSPPCRIELTI